MKLSTLTLALTTTVHASSFIKKSGFKWQDIKYVYSFGDSYSFVQGTRGHAGYSFIGDAFDLGFTPEELLSNEIIPRNTSSNGANWPEFLTGCFGGLPSKCPIQLWDFAFAGSDIDSALLPLHHNYTIPLVDQVKQYVQYASDILPHPERQTLFTWFEGINDTGDTINNATIPADFWEREMTSYFGAVEKAHSAAGGNAAHLFINVTPGQRTPARNGNSAAAVLQKNRIGDYNAALSAHVKQFAASHPTTKVMLFDANAWFEYALDNYAALGFENITGFCTCDDNSYFWYNSGHPTEKVHELLAKNITAFLSAQS